MLWSAGFVATSNVGGIPDSIRVYAQYFIRCYSNNIPITTCAGGTPLLPTLTGQYMDNFSFTIFRGAPTPGLTLSPWMFYQDAFPQYVSSMSPMTMKTNFTSQAFDTATALMKSAINRAQNASGLTRNSVLGDTAQVTTGAATAVRVDLVFRIYPGPGNYVTIGTRTLPGNRSRTSGRCRPAPRRLPTSLPPSARTSGSRTWPTTAPSAPAAMGSGPGHPRSDGTMGVGSRRASPVWDVNTWNSARMDTLEANIWPTRMPVRTSPANSGGSDWQTSYHEDDPKYTTLGDRAEPLLHGESGRTTSRARARTRPRPPSAT